MIELNPFGLNDIPAIMVMEAAADSTDFIVKYDIEQHQINSHDPTIIYLKICRDQILSGFFILVLDQDGISVEFRRIVVAEKGKGTGQKAITLMEDYCTQQLKRDRVWLDVFENNRRGRHIYQKLGYHEFGRSEHNGSALILMEKNLS